MRRYIQVRRRRFAYEIGGMFLGVTELKSEFRNPLKPLSFAVPIPDFLQYGKRPQASREFTRWAILARLGSREGEAPASCQSTPTSGDS